MILRLFAIGSMTFFLAVCSQIVIPTAPLGIPLTLQTLAVVLTAITLGPRFGILSILLYIATGALGVRVFAEGEGGWLTLFGQTGGYILGFLVCQPIVGFIVRRRGQRLHKHDGTTRKTPGTVRGYGALFIAGIVAHLVIFAIGVPWLYWVRVLDDQAETLTWANAIYYGMIVFLPGMVLKSGLAAAIGMLIVPTCAEKIW